MKRRGDDDEGICTIALGPKFLSVAVVSDETLTERSMASYLDPRHQIGRWSIALYRYLISGQQFFPKETITKNPSQCLIS